ncbi:MAG: amphi-Trp domain-containing protein [Desulfovibrio sp.]|nr:MAG: amphi-Trp domain-containing protein [Desulfovibrio sp.]
MSKQGISVKGNMDYDAVVAFLNDLVASFKAKTVCVQRGDQFVTVTPGEQIELEIEAQEKKGKQKLALELSWRTELPVMEGEQALKVSSVEPEIKEPEPEEAPAAEEGAKEEEKAEPTVSTGPAAKAAAAKAAPKAGTAAKAAAKK